MDGYRVFTWDEEKFPDRAGMLAKLDAQGFRVVTIVDPGVKHEPGYGVYDEALAGTCCAAPRAVTTTSARSGRATPSFPTSSPRRPVPGGGSSTRPMWQSGLAGIWNDMNEPATGSIEPLAMRFDRGRARTSGTTTSTRC